MKRFRAFLSLAALTFVPTLVKAAPITYTFNQTYTQNASTYFTVTGTLTTDGTLGALASSNITGFDLFVTDTANQMTGSKELSSAGANNSLIASGGLSATSSGLSFDFGNSSSFLSFNSNLNFFYHDANSANILPLAFNVYESGPQIIASVATTPEPSSLALLGTGIAAIAGVARRRYAH